MCSMLMLMKQLCLVHVLHQNKASERMQFETPFIEHPIENYEARGSSTESLKSVASFEFSPHPTLRGHLRLRLGQAPHAFREQTKDNAFFCSSEEFHQHVEQAELSILRMFKVRSQRIKKKLSGEPSTSDVNSSLGTEFLNSFSFSHSVVYETTIRCHAVKLSNFFARKIVSIANCVLRR